MNVKPAVLVLTDDGEVIADDRATGTKYIRKDRMQQRIEALEAENRRLREALRLIKNDDWCSRLSNDIAKAALLPGRGE